MKRKHLDSGVLCLMPFASKITAIALGGPIGLIGVLGAATLYGIIYEILDD